MHRCENDVFVSRHLSVGTERQKARGRAFSDLAKRYPEQWTDLREMTR